MTDTNPTRATLVLTYDDGHVDHVAVRPLGLIAAERRYGGELPPIEGALYAAWSQLRAAGSDRAGADFDTWVNGLAAIEDGSTVPPPPAATAAP